MHGHTNITHQLHILFRMKSSLLLSDRNENSNFLTDLKKNTKASNFMTAPPVVAELFCADRQTDTMALIVDFPNFARAPEMFVHGPRICGGREDA